MILMDTAAFNLHGDSNIYQVNFRELTNNSIYIQLLYPAELIISYKTPDLHNAVFTNQTGA